MYYIPPNGKKVNPKALIFSTSVQVRSKPELIKLLGDTVDLSTFDYSTGTMNSTLIKPRGRMPKTAKDKVVQEAYFEVLLIINQSTRATERMS